MNVVKCGVMHVRRKGVKRTEEKFDVGGKEIAVVQEYMYLGSVVDEHLQGTTMVEERGKAGARALSDWLRRCRTMRSELA